ncbi:hypothetical protein AYK24_09835 [Thermoplasmatales archaeon SG8-52-4]|nr:MAG: hypothetical protein AYK24_09835 [Thermoplasmatales archaeon SG8-52-4]
MAKEKNRIKEIIEDIHADPEAMKQARELAKVNSPQTSVSEGSIAEGRETGLPSGHATEDPPFNLSKEIIGIRLPESKQVLYVRKVKEFIKRLKEEIKHYSRTATYNYRILHELARKIDKLAGDELI